MQLPLEYIREMKELLRGEYPLYEACLKTSRKCGLRVNTSKISVAEFEKIAPFSLVRIPWIDNGFFYDEKENVTKHPYYFAGLYYVQEPSAMTPASRLPIMQGDRVLDMCAAPGGKATELGARLKGTGVLVANDISNSRAKALLKNLELFGIANICVTSENPKKLKTIYPKYFDKILIDAPCSGEGMFRGQPRMVEDWRTKGPEYYSVIQKELIILAAAMLRIGGQMLYSTCTFSKKENEEVIVHLLRNCPDMKLVPIKPYEGFMRGLDGLRECVRIFPYKMDGEGHFMALLEKSAKGKKGADNKAKTTLTSACLPDEATMFLSQFKPSFENGYFNIINDKVYFLPSVYKTDTSLRYLRSGLYVGELKRNRFEPSQALAMTLKAESALNVIDLSATDVRTIKYLKGETIDTSDVCQTNKNGWQLVCVDGYPLGFGKMQNNILKNKYYSGWRMM